MILLTLAALYFIICGVVGSNLYRDGPQRFSYFVYVNLLAVAWPWAVFARMISLVFQLFEQQDVNG